MIALFDRLVAPLLRTLDPEQAHALALAALKRAPLPRPAADSEKLRVQAFGLTFPNPVGIAAGFDKHAEVPDALLRLGFGFVEVGGVTPRPQPGNPRPRLFRLDADQAVINRLGLNSEGVVAAPNTPGLRNLQQAAALDELLARVVDARERVAVGAARTPVLLKIAPDLTLGDLDDAVGVARRHRVDGMIVGNTTISRPNLRETEKAKEQGGLSGRPLFALSTRMLAETYVRAEGAFPLIGAGGIDSGAAAFAKIKAGASLVQLYSGLIFRGIGLVGSIKSDLLDFLRIGRTDSLADAVGRDAAEVTAQPWPG